MKKIQEAYAYPAILLRELVKTDFKLRYQGSVLGYLWSLLRPLFLFTILYYIFVNYVGTIHGIRAPAVYLLLGIVLWNYFVEVTSGSVAAVVGKGDLLRKLNFPKYVIVIASSFSALINLGLNFIVIFIFMLVNGLGIDFRLGLLLPLIAELFLLSLGMAFFLSAAFVRFRDIAYIWEILIQAGFYLTPILYMLTLLPEKIAKILILNPLAQIIQDARYVLVSENTHTIWSYYPHEPYMWLIPIATVLLVCAIGSVYFWKRSKYFAEEV